MIERAVGVAVDRGWVPTLALRAAIRAVCAQRLRELDARPADAAARLEAELAAAPIAVETDAANAQHYEVHPSFFAAVLGPHRKYSSCYWPTGVDTLGAAEAAMLELTATRAGLADGQDILDLGCGWGALSLWAAARYPAARVVALSNSHAQRAWIERAAAERGLTNLRVVTGDITTIAPPGRFDRVASIEMFEHVRNHRALMARVASWMRPDARLFVHVFAHRAHTYLYEDRGATDWMAREFFTGGMMPALDWLPRTATPLTLEASWQLDGTHYARTAGAWYRNLVRSRTPVEKILGGGAEGRARYHRWRVFFLACEELFGYRGGREWLVAHYRFAP